MLNVMLYATKEREIDMKLKEISQAAALMCQYAISDAVNSMEEARECGGYELYNDTEWDVLISEMRILCNAIEPEWPL